MYSHPAGAVLAVPTPVTSVATTPVLETKLVIERGPLPKPNIPLSSPYPHAARLFLAVPTPVTSADTTPVLET